MSMKSSVLHWVQGLGAATGRADLPSRDDPRLRPDGAVGDDGAVSRAAAAADDPAMAQALGAYGPLIAAVRDELEHFVASQVRLHVTIADRDSFVLTALGVRSIGGNAPREVLRRFLQEFRPEQVKRYLAREVIGRLPNAAVIDLAQFAGLTDLDGHDAEEDDSGYRELVAALRVAPPAEVAGAYEVRVLGRWTENETAGSRGESRRGAAPSTPLAGRRAEFDVSDARGTRRAVLTSVVPGRRFTIGKGAECDLQVDGTYTSRRHAELWLEQGRWRIADAGSTNGIRIEAGRGIDPAVRAGSITALKPNEALALDATARIVLSARAEGPAADYPWIALHDDSAPPAPRARTTPVARVASAPETVPFVATRSGAAERSGHASAAPPTPRTAVLGAHAREAAYEIVEARDDGERRHAFREGEMPIGIGRSRGEAIVVDWSHQGVSGHHLEIDAVDEQAAHGTVHGDNGVVIDGRRHEAGSRFDWPFGTMLVLGGALPGEPECRFVLARRTEDLT